jgi:hypothetical protein
MRIFKLDIKGLFATFFTFSILFFTLAPAILPTDIALANTVPLQRQPAQQIGSWNGTYTLLAPLGSLLSPTINISTEGGISSYFDALFRAGIAIATGLALIMVMYGGFLYTSTDAITGKSEGIKIIQQALLGLLLALTSVLILNQLNPALLRNDVRINSLAPLPGINGNGGIDLDGGGSQFQGGGGSSGGTGASGGWGDGSGNTGGLEPIQDDGIFGPPYLPDIPNQGGLGPNPVIPDDDGLGLDLPTTNTGQNDNYNPLLPGPGNNPDRNSFPEVGPPSQNSF